MMVRSKSKFSKIEKRKDGRSPAGHTNSKTPDLQRNKTFSAI